jgi:transposase
MSRFSSAGPPRVMGRHVPRAITRAPASGARGRARKGDAALRSALCEAAWAAARTSEDD